MIVKAGNDERFRLYLQQMTGIEPASPAWEAGILPMNYICISTLRIIQHVKNYNALLLKLQDLSQSICQSIGSIPWLSRKAFVLLNGLLPKKPRKADSGLG